MVKRDIFRAISLWNVLDPQGSSHFRVGFAAETRSIQPPKMDSEVRHECMGKKTEMQGGYLGTVWPFTSYYKY